MSRRRPKGGEDEPVLFDLPLTPPERGEPAGREPERVEPEPDEAPDEAPVETSEETEPSAGPPDGGGPGYLSLFDDDDLPRTSPRRASAPRSPAPEPEPPARPENESRSDLGPGPRAVPDPAEWEEEPAPPGPRRVTLGARYLAGLADLAVHAGVVVLLLLGARLLGVEVGAGDWPPLAVFLLIFSLLYSVLPLAFWGRTPGMAWAGLVARTPDGMSLTFGETARRWLGWVVTVALLGLPTLLALFGGRSLADRMSHSELSVS